MVYKGAACISQSSPVFVYVGCGRQHRVGYFLFHFHFHFIFPLILIPFMAAFGCDLISEM